MTNTPTYEELKQRVKELEQDKIKYKQIEKELQESQFLFSEMFEQSTVSIQLFDPNGYCLRVNSKFCKMFGVHVEDIIDGKYNILKDKNLMSPRISKLVEEIFNMQIVNRWEGQFDIGTSADLFEIPTDKRIQIDIDTLGYPILDTSGQLKYVVLHTHDITKRKQSEEKIKASLKEKETLLHEIHHRVKNNMQIISSLLKLQSNNIEDNQTKDVLKEAQSRVYAMSAVHEMLHGSENLSKIDLKSYLSKITTAIFHTYSVKPDKVKLNYDVENISISINLASPIGLIINELISNSLKYAFPEDRKGEITVSMKKLNQELHLTVIDDGVGIPPNLDWKNSNTLGLKLVRTLVENQLDGSIQMESTNGTKFVIKFKKQ